ncbi:exonuclease SbcC [Lactobacillus selangorensis]|uniref:Nuclease SbcCD subunit C n=1 Tax=Lactobacillus selangorensis TaxID=81857 RepID=A0A0R2FK39_9LACO|nr:SMC family ATPase [Lactobacillus selangorensis]KRN28928.1 exonuclease SbcC [Lactobacillus selangorensis]KRN32662.1 exonuclease SbcC [Lactobacillus selangorensis]
MKLSKLEMNFFGPYEHETVDFAKFEEVPLFLISGQTGSGKTTIFDAMCYALFGETSRKNERTGETLRSKFAQLGDETAVTLWFSQGGKDYRIWRAPAQDFPKAHGGLTSRPAKVKLQVKQGDKELGEYQKSKVVGTMIQDLLHLTAEQFRQIVLLPQGDFQTFLMADSNDKEAVLRSLFGTQFYEDWAQDLKSRSQQMSKQVNSDHDKITGLTEHIQWVNSDDEVQAAQLKNPLDVSKLLAQQDDRLTQKAAQEQQQYQQQQEAVDQQRTTLQQAQQLADNYQKQHTAQQQLTALNAQAPAMQSVAAQIDALQWAQVQADTYKQWQTGKRHIKTQQEAVAALQQQAAQLVKDAADHQERVAALGKQQPEFEAHHTRMTQLQAKLPLYATAAQTQQAAAAQQKVVADGQQQVAQLQAQSQQFANQMAALQQQLTERDENQAQLHQADQQNLQLNNIRRQYQQVQQLHRALETAQTDLQDKQTRLAQETQTVADAQTNYQQLDSQWAAAQIAQLSQKLLPGQPCPVCGSTEHPHPASTVAIADLDEATVKEAQHALTDAQSRLNSLQGQYSEQQKHFQQAQTDFNTQWAQLIQQVQECSLDVTQETSLQDLISVLQQWSADLTAKKAAADQKQQELAAAQTQLDQQTQAADQLNEQLQSQTGQLTAATLTLTQLQAKLQTQQEQLDPAFADQQALQQHITALRQEWDQFQTDLKTQTDQLQTAQTDQAAVQQSLQDQQGQLVQQQETVQALETELTQRSQTKWPDKTDALDYLGKLLDQLDQLAAQQQIYQDYQHQLQQAQDEVRHFTDAIAGQAQPDVAAAQAQLDEMQATAETRRQHWEDTKAALQNDKRIQTELQKRAQQIRDQQDQLTSLNALVGVVAGDRSSRTLSLERYVLQTYLQEILQQANGRLASLTDGRYQFRLHHEVGSSIKNSGLEIDVYDDNFGDTRSVHTLSGGESFIAALSLALALGEVVQQESGGVTIDMLLVDEGFGALDEEALNTAMEALQSIEGKHRLIGLISHVKEMEEQIPYQLQVVKNGDGKSHLTYLLGEV